VVERVLNNLAATTREERDAAGSYRVATFLAALRPLSPERTLQKAMTAAAVGVTEEAATVFADVIERFPDSPEAEHAAQGLDSLATGPTTVN
jgi:TolA-binding protein